MREPDDDMFKKLIPALTQVIMALKKKTEEKINRSY
jgi:hypothetical protein